MVYRIAADLVVAVHLLFAVFVVSGGLLVFRWPWAGLVHVPAAAWGVLIEFTGWFCPLTPLENDLRTAAGDAGYAGGFIEHYVVGLIYPDELTRSMQIAIGVSVILVNAVAYGAVLARFFRSKR